MTPKKLDPESIYNKYDINHDGTVSDEEMARNKELIELELREEKSEAQKNMAWIAMISMIVFSAFLFVPIVSESRVTALGDILGLFYIAQAGVVGAYMGVTAWMSRK
jgi:hypothetical protein|tara:strand:+ start:522 stop:842 length:321 start_codon:yes stop_codon:yes gene_type:complete